MDALVHFPPLLAGYTKAAKTRRLNCNLTILFIQLWYSQQVAEGNAPGHPLGFDGYKHFGPIKMVHAGGGGDDLPNIDVIAVSNDAAAKRVLLQQIVFLVL